MASHKPQKKRGQTMAPPSRKPSASAPPASSRTPTSWVRCRLRAELREDAHLGSGLAGLGPDALLARDRDGRPVIWAAHIEGLLRDAARRLRYPPTTIDALFGHGGGQR